MNETELRALVSLLDDDDREVVSQVERRIKAHGTQVIPFLEQEWKAHLNPTLQSRLEDLIHRLQFDLVRERFAKWCAGSQSDLLEAIWIIATYQYPGLTYEELASQIEELHIEIWRALKDDLSPFDQIKIINSVFFRKMGFKVNNKNFYSPANYMMNTVLQSKRGNPVSLGTLYILIAEKMGLPVYGANLPNLFMLTYKTREVQFYINMFSEGLIFSKKDIHNYMARLRLTPEDTYYQTCTNLHIAARFIRNLHIALEKIGEYEKSDEVKTLMNHIAPRPSL